MKASSVLAKKAKPTSPPDSTSHRVRLVSMAAHREAAPPSRRSVISGSGLLKRNMSTAAGVRAKAREASTAAVSPGQLRTRR